MENARSAMAWALDTNQTESAMRIAVSLFRIWDTGRQEEGRRWLQQGLEQQEKLPPALLSDVLRAIGFMAGRLHDYEASLDYFGQALSVARSINDQYRIGWNLRNLAMIHNWPGDFDTNLRYLEEAQPIFEAVDDKMGICQVLEGKGMVHLLRREGELALPYIEEALSIAQELGREPTIGFFQNALGLIHNQLGRYDEAKVLLKSGLRRGGYIIHSIYGLAVAAFREGDSVRAARLVGVYDTLQQSPAEHAIPKGETAPRKIISETIAEIFDRGDAAVLAAARAQGQGFSLEKAIAYALEEIDI